MLLVYLDAYNLFDCKPKISSILFIFFSNRRKQIFPKKYTSVKSFANLFFLVTFLVYYSPYFSGNVMIITPGFDKHFILKQCNIYKTVSVNH